MKAIVALVAALFATVAFAGEPAKKDEKKAEAKKAEAKKDEKKADAKKWIGTRTQRKLEAVLLAAEDDDDYFITPDELDFIGHVPKLELVDDTELTAYVRWRLFQARRLALQEFARTWS